MQGPRGASPRAAAPVPNPAETDAQNLVPQNLVQHATQQLGPAGLQTSPPSHLSHPQSSEALSDQLSASLPHDRADPLRQHGSAQLPMAPSDTLESQLPSCQLSQHASEQPGQHQMSQNPSSQMLDHMAAHQGSGHMGCDSWTSHRLQGSQSASEPQATDQAQQQAAAAAAADRAEAHVARAEAPVEVTQPAAMAAAPQLHASHLPTHSAEGSYNPRPGHGLNQQRWQEQQLQQPSGMQMPLQSTAVGRQHHAGAAHDPASATLGDVNGSSGGVHCSEGQLASPDIGLKLGQAHSPGLSEDALGGDQAFMDAMQAMAGQLRHLHACCRLCICVQHGEYFVDCVLRKLMWSCADKTP